MTSWCTAVHVCGWTHENRKRPNTQLIAHASPPALLHANFGQRKQPVDLREVEVCTVLQRSFTANGIDVQ